jgi:hypothetical protein
MGVLIREKERLQYNGVFFESDPSRRVYPVRPILRSACPRVNGGDMIDLGKRPAKYYLFLLGSDMLLHPWYSYTDLTFRL